MHRLEEINVCETQEQTEVVFEKFIKEGFSLSPKSISLLNYHRKSNISKPSKHQLTDNINGHHPEWTLSQMDTIPNGHNPQWAQSPMDTIPNGHNPQWTQSPMDTIPNKHLPKWTRFRINTIPNEHHLEWTRSRMSTYIYIFTQLFYRYCLLRSLSQRQKFK